MFGLEEGDVDEFIGDGGFCESKEVEAFGFCWCNIDFVGCISSGGGRYLGISLLLNLSKPKSEKHCRIKI